MSAEPAARGRNSLAEQRWWDAFTQLSAADARAPLEPQDLQRLAVAAHLVGMDEVCLGAWERAYAGYLTRDEVSGAVRSLFWISFELINRGEVARSSGWIARGRRLLDQRQLDCVEHGYLILPDALGHTVSGDAAAGLASFARVVEIGERFDDLDLAMWGRNGQGRALILLGEQVAGLELLDDVMVAVVAGEISPIVSGTLYCSVIEACHEMADLTRAQLWTEALSQWCDAQPQLVPYRGKCLVYRSELLQLHGNWVAAMEEARRACDRLSHPSSQPSIGMAHYQLGELCRLRGQDAEAEAHYRQASQWGRDPQPGLALLRLRQGNPELAAGAVRRALEEARSPGTRASLLAAEVEIALAMTDLDSANRAAKELTTIAAGLSAPTIQADAAQATGSVRLAEGRAPAALDDLRRARACWQDIDAPYELARVQTLIGDACARLGDQDTAAMEFEAAARCFEQLGATPEHRRVLALGSPGGQPAPGGLTSREVEVLREVATGKTNRAIAAELLVTEKTVASHVGNIFTKLGLSSRSAATAYAYEHNLV